MNNFLKACFGVSLVIAAMTYATATTNQQAFVAVFPDGGVIQNQAGEPVCTIPNNGFVALDRNGPLEYMYSNRGFILTPSFEIFSDGYED